MQNSPRLPRIRSVTPTSGGAEVEAGGRSLVLRIRGTDLQLLDSAAVVRKGRPAAGVRADLEPVPVDGASATIRRVLLAAGSGAAAGEYVLKVGVRGRAWPVDSATFRVVPPAAFPSRTSLFVAVPARR